MKKSLLAVSALAFAGSAHAADLPFKAAPLMPVSEWTGWYFGGNIGYGSASSTDPMLSFVNPGNVGNIGGFLVNQHGNVFPNLKPSGVAGGFQVGYDKQFSSWVLGVIADIQADGWNDSRNATSPPQSFNTVVETLGASIDWFGTVRAKAGYAAGPWLFYGTGGLAYGSVSGHMGLVCLAPPGCVGINFGGATSSVRAGWTAGAGIAYNVGPHSTIGVEYLRVDLGRSSVTAFDLSGPGFFPTTTLTESQRFAEDLVRFTFNYRF